MQRSPTVKKKKNWVSDTGQTKCCSFPASVIAKQCFENLNSQLLNHLCSGFLFLGTCKSHNKGCLVTRLGQKSKTEWNIGTATFLSFPGCL